ncbi:Myosin light chain kinase, smooth muscle [Fragariocoptes setiger]|uniref:Myosin light chain kinase, smooth muscle n=1 Tax=Fragariocoptes setiger TaxID=1670756 RepID=A0ABQ7SCP2_9ACAR|nr:Myosin light chain kinase, smooth muscle [Fragariocoptes setiger]
MPKIDETDKDIGNEPTFVARKVVVKKNRDPKLDYTLGEELGRGRFGTVYRCTEKKTGLKLAAKFVCTRRREDRENVEREMDIMRSLQHRRLLQLYDAYDDGTKEMCLITELIQGGELFERVIDDDFELTEKVCAIFMRQICEGVDYMHRNSIMHLDMKPENILCVTRTGNRIKVIDFGLARRYDPKTKLQVMFGTPDFASPEVLSYDRVTPAADMWSVGVICYVLLSGLSPFMGNSDLETMANVTKAIYDFDDESFDPISKDAKDFIAKLLIKDPSKRLKPAECLKHKWLAKTPARGKAPATKLSKTKLKNTQMDLVQAFSDELYSIYDVRPPISKAKMNQITKAAIKGVKMYKHIVQCVEKFISRCRPEYKVPGLYVIDSIVRQSRHQFGADRDVYGNRFALNMHQTFVNLFHDCPIEDKAKITRVLDLWLRNGVFSASTIEPLIDNNTQSRIQNSRSPFDDTSKPPIEDRWMKLQSQCMINETDEKNHNRFEGLPSEHRREISQQVDSDYNKTGKRQRSPEPDLSSIKKQQIDMQQTLAEEKKLIETAEEIEATRREREEERKKKGLPDIKPGHLTICSTTLWLGHVPKTVSEADISDAFGEFGTITSIDLIPPRGCAYVCMDRRQDAYKALQDLKNLKLCGSWIKMAWAPGKGLKDKEFKDYWEVDIGSSYIPYRKLNLATLDIELLEKGGVIDEDTLTEDLRKLRDAKAKEREEAARKESEKLTATLPIPLDVLAVQLPPPTSVPPPPPYGIPPPLPPVMMVPMYNGPPPLAGPPPPTMGGLPPPAMSGPPPHIGGPPSLAGPPPSTMSGPPPHIGGPPPMLGPPPLLPPPMNNINMFAYPPQQYDRYECDIDMRSGARHPAGEQEYDYDDYDDDSDES